MNVNELLPNPKKIIKKPIYKRNSVMIQTHSGRNLGTNQRRV